MSVALNVMIQAQEAARARRDHIIVYGEKPVPYWSAVRMAAERQRGATGALFLDCENSLDIWQRRAHTGDMTNTETLAQKLAVSAAVDQYVEMLNTGELPEGYSFTAEPSGSKFRIVMHNNQKSVHAFVDGVTGDILYPAGWKAPTKRVCYNLLTEMELLRKVYASAKSNWTSRYLYADQIKKDRATFA